MKPKILIVDDDALLRDALAFKLSQEGFEPELAADGKKAIQKLESQSYALIISDIMMPFISGFELIEILREKGSRIPIIVLSSLESEASVDLALKLGAAAYISKPFKPKELLKELKSLLPKP